LEVRLNQPAFVYLLWVDSQGKVQPLYPWDPARGFAGGLPAPQRESHLNSPPQVNRGWEVDGPSGLETALLLVRRTPLPPEADLEALIDRLPPSKLTNPREVAWLELGPGQEAARQARVLHRSLKVDESKQIDEPLLELMERLRPHFELIKAV